MSEGADQTTVRYGLTHHTWPEPTNFFWHTAEEAWESIDRVYGPGAGHTVVERTFRVLTRPTAPPGQEQQ